MVNRTMAFDVVCVGLFMVATTTPAFSQAAITGPAVAPDYDSGVVAGSLSDSDFNTPASDGRPGVKFFDLGVRAFRKGDYAHAIDMYKVAASWAYKPAEYNLAVMYFKGQGIAADRPLGAAWGVLAAERHDPQYVKVQNLMISLLSDAQFAQTNAHWRELKKTYGDDVALPRAKAQWAWARTHQTGTRTGGYLGTLRIGVADGGHTASPKTITGAPVRQALSAADLLQGGSVDGSTAYAQFRESADPYSPVYLKNPDTGTVVVGPIDPAASSPDRQ